MNNESNGNRHHAENIPAAQWYLDGGQRSKLENAIKLAFTIVPAARRLVENKVVDREDLRQTILLHMFRRNVALPDEDRDLKAFVSVIVRNFVVRNYLQKLDPEGYRLTKRIKEILHKRSDVFSCSKGGSHNGSTKYWLNEIGNEGRPPSLPEAEAIVSDAIPMVQRDYRLTGRNPQEVIISDTNLVGLMTQIFKTVKGPMTTGMVSSLTMSRIPLLRAINFNLEDENGWLTGEKEGQRSSSLLTTVADTHARVDMIMEQMSVARPMAVEIVKAFLQHAPQKSVIMRLRTVLYHLTEDLITNNDIALRLHTSKSSTSAFWMEFQKTVRYYFDSHQAEFKDKKINIHPPFVATYLHPALIEAVENEIRTRKAT